MTLMEKYLDKGDILYSDNWYSSPKLFQSLYECSTGACSTVKKNRSGFPKFQRTLQRGEQSVQHTPNMIAIKWHDKKDVFMLSTVHNSTMVLTEKRRSDTSDEILKPLCIIEYNKNRGIVDKSDMQITFSESIQKSFQRNPCGIKM
jgi:hypothetical protein